MVRLFGQDYSRQALQAYTGNLAQVGGIHPVELAAGRERGVRAFEITTGTGFACTVVADRALDIAQASFRGRSLAFLTPAGSVHPAYYEPEGAGWLRSFPGGLLTTCGLTYVGAAGTDAGETCGIHGRISNLPAEELGFWGEWQDDVYTMHVQGTMTESVLFGSTLRLTRHLSARLGESSIRIDDVVENLGGAPAPLMILYHCNLGFPVLAPTAQLVTESVVVEPRDADAAAGLARYMAFEAPTVGYAEQVFYHQMRADIHGDVRLALINPTLDEGLGVFITYHQKSLPHFVQWKMMGHGAYALGLEPANCHVGGRAEERASGRLQQLQPGEQRTFHLEIGVLAGRQEIEDYTQAIKLGG